MPRTYLLVELVILRKRQKASCGHNSVASYDYRAIMKRSIWYEDVSKYLPAYLCIYKGSCLYDLIEPCLSFKYYQRSDFGFRKGIHCVYYFKDQLVDINTALTARFEKKLGPSYMLKGSPQLWLEYNQERYEPNGHSVL